RPASRSVTRSRYVVGGRATGNWESTQGRRPPPVRASTGPRHHGSPGGGPMFHDHIPFPSATRRAALAALLALSGTALGGCYSTTPSGGGGTSTPTTASVSMTAWFPANGAYRCVSGSTWTYQLLSTTGTAGSGESIRSDHPTEDFFPTNDQ